MPGAGLARGWSLPQTPVARVAKLRSNIGVSCAPPIAMAEEGGKSSCWEKRSSSSSGEKVVWTFFSGHTLLWGPSWFRLWKNLPQNSHVMVVNRQVQTKKQFQLCRLGFKLLLHTPWVQEEWPLEVQNRCCWKVVYSVIRSYSVLYDLTQQIV